MHELSVCIALLDKVQSIASERHATSVSQIVVKLGPLSGVEAPLLQNAYPLAAAGTVAEDAELLIETAGVVVRCSQCDAETEVPVNRLLCGDCGDYRTNIVSGDELVLARVELETTGDRRDNGPAADGLRHIGA